MTPRSWFRRLCLVVAVGVIVGACDLSSTPVESIGATSTSKGVETTVHEEIDYYRYVEDVIGILELELWRSDEVDWEQIRESVLGGLSSEPTPGEAYLAAERVVTLVNDRHTWFYRTTDDGESSDVFDVLPFGELSDGSVGYLYLPGTRGPSGDGFAQYATVVNDAMRAVEEDSPVCGWVIDLRENRGGSVFVMLLGLGPLFGEGVFLSYPDGATEFSYVDADLLVNGVRPSELDYSGTRTTYESPYVVERPAVPGLVEGMQIHTDRYTPVDPDAPVAVLISGATASAGEGVLIGFIGRPDTRTFGRPTDGVPTGAKTISFADGASLRVAGSKAQDRQGTLYSDAIRPDERIVDLYPLDDEDEALNAATNWVKTVCP